MLYILYTIVSVFLLLSYFSIARRYNITDQPNHRSSHKQATILGGGFVFPLILLLHSLINGFQYPLFSGGLFLISSISFYDDLRPLSNKIRIICHLIAVSLMFSEAGLLSQSIWLIMIGYIIMIGTINAYNFMDGINGITASYSLVMIMSLYYINSLFVNFVESEWLIAGAIPVLVFGFFNFRRKAKCFAGDVGSISMAFILVFFLLSLMLKTGDFKYLGLFLVYGLDSVTTIVFRLIRRENIFMAHRSHFYQSLANIRALPHLVVSTLYAMTQLIVNMVIIHSSFTILSFVLLLTVSGLVALALRLLVEGKEYLLKIR